jgi:hypothetical protein
VISAEGYSTASDFLTGLLGKPIEVLLVDRDWRGSDLLSGILTHVYTNAIVLTRLNSEQLIYLHAVAMIQEGAGNERPFQANITTVQATADPGTTSKGIDLPLKYIGE